ncbi:MAG: transcription antitermination factor NusB [Parvularculales bacterium]
MTGSCSSSSSGTPRRTHPAARHAAARHAARLAAVQALYQMEITGIGVNTIIVEFTEHRLKRADHEHFDALVTGVVHQQAAIDGAIADALAAGWRLERLDSTLRAIVRAGVYELMHMDHIPVAVIIDDYLDTAHAFFNKEQTAFVNGVLDSLGRTLRPNSFS